MWIYQYFYLIFILFFIFLVLIFLLFQIIIQINKKHLINNNKLKAEAWSLQEDLYAIPSGSRALYRIFMLPQYVAASLNFAIAIIIYITLSTVSFEESEIGLTIFHLLTIMTVLSLIQLTGLAGFLVKLGVFSGSLSEVADKISVNRSFLTKA